MSADEMKLKKNDDDMFDELDETPGGFEKDEFPTNMEDDDDDDTY